MDWSILTPILLATAAAFVWAIRLWIKATIERGVETKFSTEIEALKSDLRLKETSIAALQNNVLSGRANRQAMLEKRKIEAIDEIWAATLRLARFNMAALAAQTLKLDEIAEAAPKNPGLRDMIKVMSGGDLMKELAEVGGESERPFLSLKAWALFSAYKTTLMFFYLRMHMIATGLEGTNNLLKNDSLLNMVRTALPGYESYLEQYGLNGVPFLVDNLRDALLESLRASLDSSEADHENAAQTAKLLKLVEDVNKANNQSLSAQVSLSRGV
jgi:hypothetical protein